MGRALTRIILLYSLLLIGTSSCSEEGSNQDSSIIDNFNAVGTWEFTRVTCEDVELTLNNYSEVIYISEDTYTSITTGSGCAVEWRDADWSIYGLNLRVGGGSYGCGMNPCEFNYSISANGMTSSTDTLFCPNDLGSPPPLSEDTPAMTLSSDTELSLTLSDGGVSCIFYYEKTSTDSTVPEPTQPTTWISLDSPSGAPIGGGRDRNYNSESGTFDVNVNGSNAVVIGFDHFTSSNYFDFEFIAPFGNNLAVGVYSGATRYPFQNATDPGMDVSGNHMGCSTITGSFEVLEVVYNGGDIETLAIDFEQYCGSNPVPLSGSVRINSSTP